MKLYVVRHGIAAQVGERGGTCDAQRVLSVEGKARVREVARGLSELAMIGKKAAN